MTATMEQFDGEFIHITARDIRDRDVILGAARTVTATPDVTGAAVAVTTITGPETYDADTPVYVFRPAPGCADEPCPGCDAAPGEPCDWTCPSYPALDDAAGTNVA